jgi:starch phosphorylase
MNPDEGAQDWSDSQDLYRILEDEIVPRYYDRDDAGLPQAWLTLMRQAMATTLWRFSTTRMLHDYVERMYLPSDRPAALAATAAGPKAAVSPDKA